MAAITPEDAEARSAETALAGEEAWPSRNAAYYSLFVLTIVVTFTVLDRQILSLLIEPIKADFGITDTAAALLLGAAFSIPYAIAGFPIARLADTGNRRNLIAGCIALWSAATTFCGFAGSYVQLLIARLVVGAGESGYGPATWSIVTDSFRREKVALATGTLAVGATLGAGLALFLGGAILGLVEHLPATLPFVGEIKPWHWAFVIVGAPGMLWALVVLTTKEPVRRGAARAQRTATPVIEVVRFMGKEWRAYLASIGGIGMKYLIALGISAWMPTLIHREFQWPLSQIGIIQGSIGIVAAPLGMLIGAHLSERWTRQGSKDANLRISFYSLLLATPLSAFAPLLPDPWLVLGVYGITVFMASLAIGPGVAAFQLITPPMMRAQVGAVCQFSSNVVAFAVGPLIVALFTDQLFRDPMALKYSMSLAAGLLTPVAIFTVWQGLKPYARAYERATRETAQ